MATDAAATEMMDSSMDATCEDRERAHMAWHVVRDRRVVQGVDTATTTYEPDVYAMLWIVHDSVKNYTRFWLPAVDAKYPRAIKFARCSSIAPTDPIRLSWKTLTAIRCEGARPMIFAAASDEIGRVVVAEAFEAKPSTPVWSVVAGDSPEAHRSFCTLVESPALSAETYFRDLVGPRTFP